jgi:hypothetical protein
MASQALRLRNARSLSDPRHLLRYLKSQAGLTFKDIANLERVSEATVRASVAQVEAYRVRNTVAEFDFAARDLFISCVPQAKETLQGLLAATELVEQKQGKSGVVKVVKVEDKTTRLEALRVLTSIATALQPKQPTAMVNVQQTNQTAVVSQSETSEERFARLRKQAEAHYLLPPEVAAVPSHIDAGEDADDADDDDEDEDDDESDEE